MFLARAEDPGLLVLPTHRLVRTCRRSSCAALRAGAAAAFDVTRGDEATPRRSRRGSAREGEARHLRGARGRRARRRSGWRCKPNADLSSLGPPALRTLDVTVLHGVVLGPLLGIDAAAMAKQSFLGYTHDTARGAGAVEAGGRRRRS